MNCVHHRIGGRWYDPEVGRFITVDPAEDGENWYGYCENNPTNVIDPDGRFKSPAQAAWLLAGPFYYAWDILKGVNQLYQLLMPYPFLPQEVNSIIVGYKMAEAVYRNPSVILDFAKNVGNGVIHGFIDDIVKTVSDFPKVVLGRPTDEEVRVYGKNVTGTVLTVIAAVKVGKIVVSGIQGGKTFAQVSREVFKESPRGRRNTVLPDGSVFKEVEELHHWLIPQRAKWAPNWLKNARWNLKRLWTIEHAMQDPFRYKFMPKNVKNNIDTLVK